MTDCPDNGPYPWEPKIIRHDHPMTMACLAGCPARTELQKDKEMAAVQSELNKKLTKEHVDHPAHYNQHPSGIECIEVVRHFNFNVGNVIKYLWRSAYKDATLEDHKKALWYLQDEIARLEKENDPA